MATLTPIGGGADNDGWTPEARRACAFDILGKEGGQLAKRGRVLFHDNFETGEIEHWRQHFHGFAPRSAVGLTSYPTRNGRFALQIGTGTIPYNANDISNRNSALRNLSQYREEGVVSFSGWTTLRSGIGAQPQATSMPGRAWREFMIAFDIQSWDNTRRSFPKVMLIEPSGSDIPQWYITSNSGSLIAIPNSAGAFSGENENKYNFDYWRFTWDMRANAGMGNYLEFQINNRVFDLRGLGGGAAANTPPQVGAGVDSFAGGFNCALAIERSSKWPDHYPATLYADDLVCTIGDTLA